MKIAVLGAGAMGSLVGAHLKKGGGEVYLIDVYKEHMDAVAKDGLYMEINSAVAPETVKLDGAVTDGKDIGVCDAVILLVKCYSIVEAIEANRNLFGKSTIVLSLQNGWGAADVLKTLFDEDHIGYGMLKASATLFAPGKIFGSNRFPDSPKGTYFAPVKKDTPYAGTYTELVKLFEAGGMPAECCDNVEEHIWDKLITNLVSNPLGALLQLSNHQLGAHEHSALLRKELAREICEVANGLGIKMDTEMYTTRLGTKRELVPGAKEAFTSMVSDAYYKRRTEIDFMNGAVCKEGKKLGIPTPYNETIWRLVRVMEDTYDVRFVPRQD